MLFRPMLTLTNWTETPFNLQWVSSLQMTEMVIRFQYQSDGLFTHTHFDLQPPRVAKCHFYKDQIFWTKYYPRKPSQTLCMNWIWSTTLLKGKSTPRPNGLGRSTSTINHSRSKQYKYFCGLIACIPKFWGFVFSTFLRLQTSFCEKVKLVVATMRLLIHFAQRSWKMTLVWKGRSAGTQSRALYICSFDCWTTSTVIIAITIDISCVWPQYYCQ